jgi:8-oxo-dGTP pyrophosphatase MutT (NUDIX family)
VRISIHHSTITDSSTHRWPGCLDVTVGGGIGLNETALSTIVRESAEEASLDPNFVAKTIRSSGVVSFPNLSPAGWILPGLYFVFDLRLRDDGTPEPRVNKHDGEVEGFELLSVREVLANLLDGRFKPSSALALVDFLIRHGHVTSESEPRFVDVCLSLRRNLVLPVPWSVE